MKNLLLMTTAIAAIAGAAQADVSFVKGTATLEFSQISGEPYSLIDAGASAAFSMGTYGFQFGGSSITITDFVESDSFGNSSGHVYYQAANGNKYGVFANSFAFGFSSYGVEGMFNFGPMDVEAFAGVFDDEDVAQIGVGAFYEISDGVEVSAAYSTLFDTDGGSLSEDYYTLGASYDIPNTNLAATASYRTFGDGSDSIYGIGIDWSFGPDQGERLFGARDIPVLFF